MIVRIRFGSGRLVTNRKGKNGDAARLTASMLNLGSISFAILGLWRLGQELDMLGDFVFQDGLLSHWQVWIGASAVVQYVCWRLTRYSRLSRTEIVMVERAEPLFEEEDPAVEKVTARI